MKILIVEDELKTADYLRKGLTEQGCAVDMAHNGIDGQHLALENAYDVIVLDAMLPGLDGFSVLRAVRAVRQTPVIMLTARDELPDKIAGFRAGADDYLTKPFALPELEVRLEALMARVHGRQRRKVLEVHDLKLDLATLEATRAGQPLHLYPACRKLLETLMQASPAAVTRQQLEHALWGDHPPDGDMLRSHIYELRRSVDGPFPVKLIQTLPRTGYRLAVPHASGDA